VIGFLELTAAKVIFKDFPVVLLRLLRLLRVFRLAKTLPRLRSIVEALISGFSAVGWICLLIVVFNYIAGCMCMLIFRNNDPFHWGSVGRSMFTMLRLETLDSWDQSKSSCGCCFVSLANLHLFSLLSPYFVTAPSYSFVHCSLWLRRVPSWLRWVHHQQPSFLVQAFEWFRLVWCFHTLHPRNLRLVHVANRPHWYCFN